MGFLDRIRKPTAPSATPPPKPDEPSPSAGEDLSPPNPTAEQRIHTRSSQPASAVGETPTLPDGRPVSAVGDSFHHDALLRLFGQPPDGGSRIPVIAALVPEPDNPYDTAAVAVHIAGQKVGHLSRDDARTFRTVIDEAISTHRHATAAAEVRSAGPSPDNLAAEYDVVVRLPDPRSVPSERTANVPPVGASPRFEWFSRVTDVPGVDWQPPDWVSLDPDWATVHPIVQRHPGPDGWTEVGWVDASGRRPPKLRYDSQSPVEALTPEQREGSALGLGELINATCEALMTPGTRHNYFTVLDSAATTLALYRFEQDAERARWIEQFASLAIQLVSGDPRAAVVPFGRDPGTDESTFMPKARSPFVTLSLLYVREGYLREAAQVYSHMCCLPAECRPEDAPADPTHVLDALAELLR